MGRHERGRLSGPAHCCRVGRPPTNGRQVDRSARHRFLVLIPAHDEEQLIGETLDSLAAVDYPRELFAVHVVADNCSDRTVEIAARNVHVHERHEVEHPARALRSSGCSSASITRTATTPCCSSTPTRWSVATSCRRVTSCWPAAHPSSSSITPFTMRNPHRSSRFRAAALAARNFLRPLGPHAPAGRPGYSATVWSSAPTCCGRSAGRAISPRTPSFNWISSRRHQGGVAPTPGWRRRCRTRSRQPSHSTRWERGRIQLARRFVPRLLRQSIAGGPAGRIAALDSAVDLLVPPFSVIVAANAKWSALALAGCIVAPGRRCRRPLLSTATAAAVHTAYVLSALRMVDAPAAVYRSLLGAPAWCCGSSDSGYGRCCSRVVSAGAGLSNVQPSPS